MSAEFNIVVSHPTDYEPHTVGPYDEVDEAKCVARQIVADHVKDDILCEATVVGKHVNEIFHVKLPARLIFNTKDDAERAALAIATFIGGDILDYSSEDITKFYHEAFSVVECSETVELKPIHYKYTRTQDDM